MNTAESQMTIGAQVAVMATAAQANSGDCDSDGYVEPLEWRAATTEPIPTGGGLVPLSLGISKKDPWGTEYGYCVWNHGPTLSGSGCNANMLDGYNSNANTVVALISAGPDKAFTTTCRDFATADVVANGALTDPTDLPLVSKAAETDDDIITSYTYQEATGASGGLWNLKTGDASTAVINKKIETTGSASFAGGVVLPNKSAFSTCDGDTSGIMVKNATGGIEICDGTTWTAVGGGDSTGFDSAGTCTVPADAGKVRYNAVSGMPEFCNGTGWIPFSLNIPGINLVLTPSSSNAMNLDGSANVNPSIAGVCDDGIYFCGAPVVFTLSNSGTLISSVVSVAVTNTTNFYIKATTCTIAGGNADGKLSPNESCTITVIPKATGNTTYTSNLQVTGDNNPFAILQGTSTNFGCVPGRTAPGGKYASCSPGGATYNLIVTPGGCTATTVNPVCAGGADSVLYAAANSWGWFPWWDDYNGAQLTVNQMSYANIAGSGLSVPATAYCYNLVYGGQDDWYLPADLEMVNYIFPNRVVLGGFAADTYWSSTINTVTTNTHRYVNMGGGWFNDTAISGTYRIRCARREGQALPAATPDTTPLAVTFNRSVSLVSGGAVTSNTVTVSAINQSIAVSVSGSGSPALIINGVNVGASGTATYGTTIAVTANVPAVAGTENTISVLLGASSYTWKAAYVATQTLRVFVSSVDYTGNLGGLAGADAKCASLAGAAGIGGTWQAILGVTGTTAKSRFPWNFTNLNNMNPSPQSVATSDSDFWDGTIAAAISYTENGVYKNSNVWTGTDEYGNAYASDGNDACAGYTNGSSENGYYGMSTAATGYWAKRAANENNCTTALPIYCIETAAGSVDTAPNPLIFMDQNQYSYGATIESDALTISGAAAATPMTVTIGGTGANVGFRVNGGAVVSTGTIQVGDTISLIMDFPAVSETKTVTVQIGTGPTATWTVRHISSTASCKAILDNGGSVGDGTYSIDPDGAGGLAAFNAYCDMTTDGGGWTLVENYVHAGAAGCSTPSVRGTNFPLPDMAATLGTNEAASSTKWGHASPYLLNKTPFGEMLFYCKTSAHGRVVNFKTANAGMISYAKTGSGSSSGISAGYTPLSGHSANIPGSINATWGDAGDYALTGWTMYSTSTDSYWIAYGRADSASHYYLCDEGGGSGCNANTIHRIWVR